VTDVNESPNPDSYNFTVFENVTANTVRSSGPGGCVGGPVERCVSVHRAFVCVCVRACCARWCSEAL
jgi:hypothetical protein